MQQLDLCVSLSQGEIFILWTRWTVAAKSFVPVLSYTYNMFITQQTIYGEHIWAQHGIFWPFYQ